MPKIDFYIIPETEKIPALRFVCKVIEKAFLQNHKIFIYTEDASESNLFNDLLWTFKDVSFIPHEISGDNKNTTIVIGNQNPPNSINDVLINLNQEIPNFYTEFTRIIEIVPEINEWKLASRKKYRLYKNKKEEIESHNLTTPVI